MKEHTVRVVMIGRGLRHPGSSATPARCSTVSPAGTARCAKSSPSRWSTPGSRSSCRAPRTWSSSEALRCKNPAYCTATPEGKLYPVDPCRRRADLCHFSPNAMRRGLSCTVGVGRRSPGSMSSSRARELQEIATPALPRGRRRFPRPGAPAEVRADGDATFASSSPHSPRRRCLES